MLSLHPRDRFWPLALSTIIHRLRAHQQSNTQGSIHDIIINCSNLIVFSLQQQIWIKKNKEQDGVMIVAEPEVLLMYVCNSNLDKIMIFDVPIICGNRYKNLRQC